ncbi:MAG: VTT domain-containing protein [Candidatus Absconditabacteria bacterium]
MNSKTNKFFIVIIFVLFALGISVSSYLYFSGFDFEVFFQQINLNISYKVILILMFYLFRNYLLIPSTVVILFSGYYLQHFWLSLLIALIGVTFGFLQTYFVGYTFSESLAKSKKFHLISQYNEKIQKQGYKVIFLGALFPVMSVDALYYSAGLIKYNILKAYLAGIIGELPLIILYVYLGKQAQNYTHYFFYIFLFLVLGYLVYFLGKQRNRKKIT